MSKRILSLYCKIKYFAYKAILKLCISSVFKCVVKFILLLFKVLNYLVPNAYHDTLEKCFMILDAWL